MERIHGVAKAAYTIAFLAVGRSLVASRLRWLDRYRGMATEERAAERDRLLVRLYRFAWDHVAFYRRLYESSGLVRGDVRGLRDLGRLPLVSKDMMKAAPLRDLRPPRWRTPVLNRVTTSGSSGAPFAFYRSLALLSMNAAQLLAYLQLWRVPARRRMVFILYNADPTIGVRIPETARFAPFSSAGSLHPSLPAAELVRAIRRRRPDCVITIPSMVEDIVDAMSREDAGGGDGGRGGDGTYREPITFATGAEVLTERLRQKLAVAFPRCRVFDMYNAVETGMMAVECEHRGGRHLNDYAVVLEEGRRVTDADGESYVTPVFTNLWSYGTPIIRYTGIEDLLQTGPSRCACAPGGTVVTRIIGRESEFVRSPDGRSCSVDVLGAAHADLGGVVRFQYVQGEPSALVLRYVASPAADHAAIARSAEAAVRKLLGPALRFSCQAVDHLEKRTTTLKQPMLVRT